jgi:integrase
MGKWIFSRVSNMVRYAPSGTYYMRVKVGGKIIRRSLKTNSESMAVRLLPKAINDERSRHARRSSGGQTMADAAELYLKAVASKPGIKPRSVDYRRETWEMIKRTWKGIETLPSSDVTKSMCEDWADRARLRYASTRFNGCLETLRGLLRHAVATGNRIDNPAMEIKRIRIPIEPPTMPSPEQMTAILDGFDGKTSRAPAGLTVRLLAYTGLRINELRNLKHQDIDLAGKWITARVTKNGEVRKVPIISAAIEPLKDFLAGQGVVDPRRALRTVSKSVGLDLTPHDMRHLFATRCLESGVDVKTVASWLGHKDGGALLLKMYAHLRDHHSQKMARKVKF